MAEIKRQQEGTKFSVATTALLLRQMLAAIKAIHDIGYLHRDVKPSNFVLGLERVPELHGRQRCYIVDFGLARRYLTTEGQVRQVRVISYNTNPLILL